MNQKLTWLITGDRNWRDALTIMESLELELQSDFSYGSGVREPSDILVRSGDAPGADMYGDACAQILGMQTERWPADWDKYGRAAGPRRNTQMLIAEPRPDFYLAFHTDIENSRGTKDMIRQLVKAGIPGRLIDKESNG